MNPIILFGSPHVSGSTRQIVDDTLGSYNYPLVNLYDYQLYPFFQENFAEKDDFLPLMEKILPYDTWIIATPVYWYSMSTQHKIFFDRFADLLANHKEIVDQLIGKKLFVLATFGSSYPRGFEDIFEQICDYLKMVYLGTSFFYGRKDQGEFLEKNKFYQEKMINVLSVS